MVYSIQTKKGKAYLHRRRGLFWFSKTINREYAIDEVPEGYEVEISKKTGMPLVKKCK